MTYKRKRKNYGKNKNYSVINKLIKENKVNEKFLLNLNQLSLEELISLKLEMSVKTINNGYIYGIPIWNSLLDVTRDACLRFAISASRTKAEAANFLGISISTFKEYVEKYDVMSFFEENDD